jgi:hypothetical protein
MITNAAMPSSVNGAALPDSVFTWQFTATNGDSWGGTLIADSILFNPGDTIAAARGTYRILLEDARGVDLTPAGLEDGQVFVEWYWQQAAARFLPTRNGADAVAGIGGLGSERDQVWTGAIWQSFGIGGQEQPSAPLVADTRFTWTFEADSGDRWSGVLFDSAAAADPGSTFRTAHGTYRITAEEALAGESLVQSGTVRLVGTYHDSATGRQFAVQGAGGAMDHGHGGLGSELGTAWNGVAWRDFGLEGAAQIDGPLPFTLAVNGFGLIVGGWGSQDRYPRILADVNGDGRADVVGFGVAGTWVALARPSGGYEAASLAIGNFGEVIGGWTTQDRFPRTMADVNGDGRADVVGFGLAGVWVALADGAGGFATPALALGAFGEVAGGWTSQDLFPRTVADVNGDGRADVVGFGRAGVWVALANGSGGFDAPRLAIGAFGAEAGGWSSQDRFPRMLADVNGDGWAEVIGFGNAGVYVESVFGFA